MFNEAVRQMGVCKEAADSMLLHANSLDEFVERTRYQLNTVLGLEEDLEPVQDDAKSRVPPIECIGYSPLESCEYTRRYLELYNAYYEGIVRGHVKTAKLLQTSKCGG